MSIRILVFVYGGHRFIKRLKNKLLTMSPQTTTYESVYDGTLTVLSPSGSVSIEYAPIYYDDDIGFLISHTHKLAQDKPTVTIQIPCEYLCTSTPEDSTKVHMADFCLREFKRYIDALNAELYNRSRPDNESGKYYLHIPNGEILVRNSTYFAMCPQRNYEYGSGSTVYLLPSDYMPSHKMCLCILIQVQLPKHKIRKTIQMLCNDLPRAVKQFIIEFDFTRLESVMKLARKQTSIRMWLKDIYYCAFIANGSILPRSKGTDLPLESATPFKSPPDDEIDIFGVCGMGIKKGITVITGGGYSGKSTLLDTISKGIYDHVLGDGRELCITDESSFSISAEDGRCIKCVNISPFIKWLPNGDTRSFSTVCASGSTSQAANIMEAIDYGAKLILIDEDRSATNFMIQVSIMKELIEKEPIIPFTSRVNDLYNSRGVSTILVIGGSGEYISVADKIYIMEDYLIHDVTDKAKTISTTHGISTRVLSPANWMQNRILCSDNFSSYPQNSGSEKLEVSDMGFIIIGDECINTSGLHDIVSPSQLDTLGFMLRYLMISNKDCEIDITERIDEMYKKVENEGLEWLYSSFFTSTKRFLDLPRKQELLALVNRMKKIHYKMKENVK